MQDHIHRFLFPKSFREAPYRRQILNFLRGTHIICLCVFFGGLYFDQQQSLLLPWLIGTIVSGLGMFMLDLYGSCMALFEVKGMTIVIKIGLLTLLPVLDRENQLYLLAALIIFSSLLSHSRRSLRHKNIIPKSFRHKYGIKDER